MHRNCWKQLETQYLPDSLRALEIGGKNKRKLLSTSFRRCSSKASDLQDENRHHTFANLHQKLLQGKRGGSASIAQLAVRVRFCRKGLDCERQVVSNFEFGLQCKTNLPLTPCHIRNGQALCYQGWPTNTSTNRLFQFLGITRLALFWATCPVRLGKYYVGLISCSSSSSSSLPHNS